ncbi:MAG: hypothetical protein RR190_00705 [Bacteroidales bacterium]
MLILISKNNTSLQFVFFVVISLLLWGIHFFNPIPVDIHSVDSFLYADMVVYLRQFTLFSTILSCLLWGLQAWILYFSIVRNHLSKNAMFVPLIYMILISNNSELMCFHPFILVNFFLVLSYVQLLSVYEKTDTYPIVFNAAFLWSIASLFYIPIIYTFPLFFLVFMVFSLNKWREWMIAAIGLIFPYLSMFALAFIGDSTTNFVSYLLSHFQAFPDFSIPAMTFSFSIRLFIIGLTLLSIFIMFKNIHDMENPQRKKIWVFAISFIYFVIAYLFFWQTNLSFYPAFIFSAYFISELFTRSKTPLWVESLFYILFFMILAENYVIL